MCYSALVKQDVDELSRRFGAAVTKDLIDDYDRRSLADPKRFPKRGIRIFPGDYAPVVFTREGQLQIELMRYGVPLPAYIPPSNNYTTFNARRDNLTSPFWSESFLKHHGFVVLRGFYEWVAVKDLLRAGVVTADQIQADFQRQTEKRKARILAAGKKYKPTATETKDFRFRQIVIRFVPEDAVDLLVPVICSFAQPTELHSGGFAIITDLPTPEIAAAGHDRCPIVLSMDSVKQWLTLNEKNSREMDRILEGDHRVTFLHSLAEAA